MQIPVSTGTFQQGGETLPRSIDALSPAAMPKQSLTSAPGAIGRPVEHRRSPSSVIEVVVLRLAIERLFLSMRANSVRNDRKEWRSEGSSCTLFYLMPGVSGQLPGS